MLVLFMRSCCVSHVHLIHTSVFSGSQPSHEDESRVSCLADGGEGGSDQIGQLPIFDSGAHERVDDALRTPRLTCPYRALSQ